jgi:hypothetical protein
MKDQFNFFCARRDFQLFLNVGNRHLLFNHAVQIYTCIIILCEQVHILLNKKMDGLLMHVCV